MLKWIFYVNNIWYKNFILVIMIKSIGKYGILLVECGYNVV